MSSASCPSCGLQFAEIAPQSGNCPNCGQAIETAADGGGLGLIRGYFFRIWQILTQPSVFFRTMPVKGGVSGPLAFALITHWLGSAIASIWRMLIGGAIGGYLDHFVKMASDVAEVDNPGRHAQVLEITDRLQHWLWGAGSVIADPFLTLAQIFFISFLVFVGARIFVTPGKNGAPREITFESALRVVCYGMTPSILAVLPIFGWGISYFYQAIVTVIGARETYRIDTARATFVAFFPQILLLGFFMMIFVAISLAFIKFFATTF